MYLAEKTYRWKKIYLHEKAQIDNTWILEPCNIIKQEYQNSDKKLCKQLCWLWHALRFYSMLFLTF